jgi:hypothetical protein
MKKYVVVFNFPGEEYREHFDTLQEANEWAEWKWGRLTEREKKERSIYVGLLDSEDLDEDLVNDFDKDENGIDWGAVTDIRDIPQDGFRAGKGTENF